MAATMTEFQFDKARRDFTEQIVHCVQKGVIDGFLDFLKKYPGNDAEKKMSIDQAIRDEVKTVIKENAGCEIYKKVIQKSLELAQQDVCSNWIPFSVLSDVFDVITIEECEEVFSVVEENISVWKEEMFYAAGKNYLLRMCNDILRRLSKSQNTVFCGRIQLFLSRLFPLSEKSALNLMSNFNLENITTYIASSENFEDSKDEIQMEIEGGTQSKPVDYTLYRRFWALQDFFRKPNQCYEKLPLKQFMQNADHVLNAFQSSKLDDLKSSRRKLDRHMDTSTFFAKYLTSEKLLDLQLNDSNFRRFVLVQFLILFQYLNATVKFKTATQALSEENTQWTKTTQERVYQLIRETPPDGEKFASTVEHILEREEHWNAWKNEGCPSFQRQPSKDSKPPARRAKRKWVGDDLQASGGKLIKMGNAELTRLWNINPDNMAACKDEKRVFLPNMESYFEEAIEQIDPEAQVEAEYRLINEEIYQWKALRLLARRSPHFFTQTTQPAMQLPAYLEVMLNKIAKEIPQTTSNEDVKTEIGEEEEEEEEEAAMKESQEEVDLKQNGSMSQDITNEVKEEAAEEPIQTEVLEGMASILAGDWKKLATELNFTEEDIASFEAESEEEQPRALKMLTVWQSNEGERATKGTLKIALKEVGLIDAMESLAAS